MKFSQIAKGITSTKETSFQYGDQDVKVLLRPLTAGEEVEIIAHATSTTKKKGVEPKPGDPVYETELQAEALKLVCLDPDSDASARSPTFASVDEVLKLDVDTVVMLYEQHRIFQEECSPTIRKMGTADLFKLAKEVAEGDDPFAYARFSPNTRWILQHFTAVLLSKSPAFKEHFSQSSEASTSSENTGATLPQGADDTPVYE